MLHQTHPMALHPLPTEITAGDLRLRIPVLSDAPALIEACQDPEIPRWTRVPSPYGAAEADAFITESIQWAADGDLRARFVLIDANDTLLGMIGLVRCRADEETAEVGYWLAPHARGKGNLTSGLRALVASMLIAGWERIEAEVISGNEASQRALERVGFTFEGTVRSVAFRGCGVDRRRIDVHLSSIIRTDPTAVELLTGG